MLRRPLLLLLVAACALVLSSCGGTTYVDTNLGDDQPMRGAGWQGIEPIDIELPTDEPVREDQPQTVTAVKPGTATIVNIWASFCAPCKDELPLLQAVAASGKVQVLGFTRDSHRDRADEALTAAKVTYPNWMDPEAKVAVSLKRIPINAIPTSVLVRDGKAIAVHIGPFPDKATILAALEIR